MRDEGWQQPELFFDTLADVDFGKPLVSVGEEFSQYDVDRANALLDEMGLTAAFRDKGRFAEFMGNFAVTIVEDDYAALTGCAAYLAGGGKG